MKKYKLYRAISGDRKVDAVIAELEPLVAPKPPPPPRVPPPAEPPPPPRFQETDKGRRRTAPRMPPAEALPLADPFEMTSVSFEIGEDSGKARMDDPFPFIPTRDGRPRSRAPRGGPRPRIPRRSFAPPSAAASSEAPPAARCAAGAPGEPEQSPVRPTGRALADLYYAQGHYAEALQIYDDLVMRHPFDDELKRMRRDAEARLLPASTTPSASAPDLGLERRLARIRALKQWLSLVQAG